MPLSKTRLREIVAELGYAPGGRKLILSEDQFREVIEYVTAPRNRSTLLQTRPTLRSVEKRSEEAMKRLRRYAEGVKK